ncbi:MAG: 5-oxoprolinase subunit PxpB [Undibacterium sp.]|nr:5-oxoprolinase subunit PxpB [Undibacterium sp.]
MQNPAMSFYLLGERAAVMQSHSPSSIAVQRKIWCVAQQLQLRACCEDIVPGMNNLTAIFDPYLHSSTSILATLKNLWDAATSSHFSGREITIPVHYGGGAGPDLEVVALANRLEPEQVVRLHSEASYLVFFLGFQPGFAYLGGLPEKLATARRSEPRLKIPKGSVGIGGSQTGIYPADSPGGWQIIGRTSFTLFNSESKQPCLLLPGDTVRFAVESLHV